MQKELSVKLIKNYFKDFLKIRLKKNLVLDPLFFTHYLTLRCNFNCCYCGFAQNSQCKARDDELNTENTLRLLDIIRKESPYIYFTGGEPLMRDDIVEILRWSKEHGFKSISVNTNMSLIHKKMDVLEHITNLVASYDMTDREQYAKILGTSVQMVKLVEDNIVKCAKLQKEKNFVMTINCVVTPVTLNDTRNVMDFCFKNNIRFAIVPAEFDNGDIDPELKNNSNFRQLVKLLILKKKDNPLIFNTEKYLDTILDFKRFDCYPTLTPHTYPNGDLFYPCEPLKKVAANLLETASYKKALGIGIDKHGQLPMCKDKCHKACYIEPSCYVKNPLLLFRNLSK